MKKVPMFMTPIEAKDCLKCAGGDMLPELSLTTGSATELPTVGHTSERYNVLKCRECGYSEPVVKEGQ